MVFGIPFSFQLYGMRNKHHTFHPFDCHAPNTVHTHLYSYVSRHNLTKILKIYISTRKCVGTNKSGSSELEFVNVRVKFYFPLCSTRRSRYVSQIGLYIFVLFLLKTSSRLDIPIHSFIDQLEPLFFLQQFHSCSNNITNLNSEWHRSATSPWNCHKNVFNTLERKKNQLKTELWLLHRTLSVNSISIS